MSEEIEPHILDKYEILQRIGKGAYATVWKVIDKATQKTVALKKLLDVFQNLIDARRTFKDVMLLNQLNNHENIISLLNIIRAENDRNLYLILNYMETDLQSVIRAGILEDIHKQYITYQLLKALKYIHTGQIIHNNLKPSVILLNSECLVKLADFGEALSVAYQEEDSIDDIVCAKWYSSPEKFLGSRKLTAAADIFSIGCIIGEMINGRPLFPGTSRVNSLERIIEITGRPSADDMKTIQSTEGYLNISMIRQVHTKQFHEFFPTASEEAIDFLRKLLQFNPEKRLTAEEALGHPYVSQFQNPDDEPVYNGIIEISNNNGALSIEKCKDMIYDICKSKE